MTFDDFDKLNLKAFAENLFQIMEKGSASSVHDMGQKGSYTISLNAQFGNGKTTFLKMFEHFIKNQKSSSVETSNKEAHYGVLFVNAWESDFYKEPVIAILSEFVNWVTQESDDQKNIPEAIINITKGVIGVLGNIVTQAVRITTDFNLTEAIESSEPDNNLFEEKEIISKGDDILNNFKIRKNAINEIKNILSNYLKSNNKKLLIIVDELDRARPDYAVHFLEDMKHFFDIENVIFLVAVNRIQMEATVKCLYGQELDFEGYYRKFFKQELDLPDPYKEAQKFVDNLVQKTEVKFDKEELSNKKIRIDNCYLSCKLFQLTLREIENFMRMFELILKSKEKITRWTYMDCYSFFIALFIKNKEIFNQILIGNFTVSDFKKFLNENKFISKMLENSNSSYSVKTNDINYLLATVAYSLIEGDPRQQNLIYTREKIERYFGVSQDFSDPVTIHPPDNFEYYDGIQPAVEICENINQCKSTSNK